MLKCGRVSELTHQFLDVITSTYQNAHTHYEWLTNGDLCTHTGHHSEYIRGKVVMVVSEHQIPGPGPDVPHGNVGNL